MILLFYCFSLYFAQFVSKLAWLAWLGLLFFREQSASTIRLPELRTNGLGCISMFVHIQRANIYTSLFTNPSNGSIDEKIHTYKINNTQTRKQK